MYNTITQEFLLTMTSFNKVKQFHQTYKANIGTTAAFPDSTERALRKKLLLEEFTEYTDAEDADDFVEVCDALGDMLYIIYGTAVSYGIPIDKVFDEIHDSNMSKLGEDGRPIFRDDGKVLKGPNYHTPDIQKVLDKDAQSNHTSRGKQLYLPLKLNRDISLQFVENGDGKYVCTVSSEFLREINVYFASKYYKIDKHRPIEVIDNTIINKD